MIELRPDQFLGSFVPLVTPFNQRAVDYHAFAALIDWHVAHGTHGVVVCSDTTGESSLLTTLERRCLTSAAVEIAACRLSVVVATASSTHGETVELTEHAAGAGADAVILAVPSYAEPSRDELIAHLADLAERSSLPALVHRRPTRWRSDVDISVLAGLTLVAPNVVGVVQSGIDLAFVTEAVLTFGLDFRILADVEEMSYFMLAAGAHGIINSLGNVVPARIAELYYAVVKDGLAEGLAAHHRLYQLNRAIGMDADPVPLKRMMWRLGLLATNEHRSQSVLTTDALAAHVDAMLTASGLGSDMESSELL